MSSANYILVYSTRDEDVVLGVVRFPAADELLAHADPVLGHREVAPLVVALQLARVRRLGLVELHRVGDLAPDLALIVFLGRVAHPVENGRPLLALEGPRPGGTAPFLQLQRVLEDELSLLAVELLAIDDHPPPLQALFEVVLEGARARADLGATRRVGIDLGSFEA